MSIHIPIPIPIILYVDNINFLPQPDLRIERRKSAIKLELKRAEAIELIENLNKRIQNEPNNQAFQILFNGRLYV